MFVCVLVWFGLVLVFERMANGEEKSNDDLYAVLGLEKECTASELRNAYKKLALVRIGNLFLTTLLFLFFFTIQLNGPCLNLKNMSSNHSSFA